MKYLFLIFTLSCTQDVSIMKVYDEENDTSVVETPVTQETNEEEPSAEISTPSAEPSDEETESMSELTIGFGEIHFRQIACPACVGESS